MDDFRELSLYHTIRSPQANELPLKVRHCLYILKWSWVFPQVSSTTTSFMLHLWSLSPIQPLALQTQHDSLPAQERLF